MLNSAPELPYLIVLYAAAVHELAASLPDVKSEVKVFWLRPTSFGHDFLVGSQSVNVWATVSGSDTANAAAVDREKCMMCCMLVIE